MAHASPGDPRSPAPAPGAADLAYVRAVAEAGRAAPLLSGRFFVTWGVLTIAATLAHWALLTGRLPAPSIAFLWLWVGYGAIGAVANVVLGRSLAGKPGLASPGNRVEGAAWTAVGLAIAAYAGALIVRGLITQGDMPPALWDSILAVAFAGYGVAFAVTAAIAGVGWMRLAAGASFLGAGACGFLAGSPALYLVAAVFVAVVVLGPGLMLLRAEPARLD